VQALLLAISDCSDYRWPAASILLQATSQGQRILVTSSLASEDPEVNCCSKTPVFVISFGVSRMAVMFPIASLLVLGP